MFVVVAVLRSVTSVIVSSISTSVPSAFVTVAIKLPAITSEIATPFVSMITSDPSLFVNV